MPPQGPQDLPVSFPVVENLLVCRDAVQGQGEQEGPPVLQAALAVCPGQDSFTGHPVVPQFQVPMACQRIMHL